MATTFETIRDFVRVVLGDTDATAYQFSDAVLNSHIRLIILDVDDPLIQETGTTEVFTLDLTAAQKALTTYRVAMGVVSNLSDHFSYKTPVLSVVRKGGIRQLLSYLEGRIAGIEGDTFAVSDDTFIEALVNGTERFVDEFSAAI